jgi:PKD repeat protein
MNIIIHPSYFPSISHFAAISQSDLVTFEMDDNFQKQTNRNRMYIYSPNGIQLLNIPVKNANSANQKTKDIKIETAFDWQKQHFKSLEAAYRSSPFFEYFEDDIRTIFEKKHTFLMDLNLETMATVSKCLGLEFDYNETTEYFHEVNDKTDFRHLINGKKDTSIFEPYTQVFEEKHGFINNLSILDLLFNEGRYALDYLKKQKL